MAREKERQHYNFMSFEVGNPKITELNEEILKLLCEKHKLINKRLALNWHESYKLDEYSREWDIMTNETKPDVTIISAKFSKNIFYLTNEDKLLQRLELIKWMIKTVDSFGDSGLLSKPMITLLIDSRSKDIWKIFRFIHQLSLEGFFVHEILPLTNAKPDVLAQQILAHIEKYKIGYLYRDRMWVFANHGMLDKTYKHRTIAVLNGKVIAADKSNAVLKEEVEKMQLEEEPYIVTIG